MREPPVARGPTSDELLALVFEVIADGLEHEDADVLVLPGRWAGIVPRGGLVSPEAQRGP